MRVIVKTSKTHLSHAGHLYCTIRPPSKAQKSDSCLLQGFLVTSLQEREWPVSSIVLPLVLRSQIFTQLQNDGHNSNEDCCYGGLKTNLGVGEDCTQGVKSTVFDQKSFIVEQRITAQVTLALSHANAWWRGRQYDAGAALVWRLRGRQIDFVAICSFYAKWE